MVEPSFPVRLADVDLGRPIPAFDFTHGSVAIDALIWIHGSPIGQVCAPLGSAEAVHNQIVQAAAKPAIRHLMVDLLATPSPPDGWRVPHLLAAAHPASSPWTPLVTVAVCTRNRPADLARCLDALARVDYPHLQMVVIDNAPGDDAAERLVHTAHPSVHYVREPRPGLDWARNRAIAEATGEILCFTDDDSTVDPTWVRALITAFAQNRDAMAVTGLVVRSELETEAQVIFERYGGFGRGFTPSWASIDRANGEPAWRQANSGKFGTGTNMAFRRELFDMIGGFDPSLDVGTPTNGGGDLDMFFRVLREGYELVYEPSAVVRHRHRREYADLRRQIDGWGSGFVAHVIRNMLRYPGDVFGFSRILLWWIRRWIIGRWRTGRRCPPGYPLELIAVEVLGGLTAPIRYLTARNAAARIAREHGLLSPSRSPQAARLGLDKARVQKAVPGVSIRRASDAVAVRTLDLAAGVGAIDDVTDFAATRLIVLRQGRPIGSVEIRNGHRSITAMRTRAAIAERLGAFALVAAEGRDADAASLPTHLLPLAESLLGDAPRLRVIERPPLAAHVSIAVVVATLDRPNALRRCLDAVLAQETSRRVDVIVVDNNPTSGLTPPVVSDFPSVHLVQEPRRGLAYARNAGFLASTCDIAVATDDDVIVPATWIERLIAPFADDTVMAATGHVLPLELDTSAQRLFELYGGLGRGFESRLFDRAWFESFENQAVPTWNIGATANAAFRTAIFCDPEIGLMDESLGPGMPSGVGEDTYLFYRILKAGHAIAYEPSAYVWHRHRRHLPSLRRQLYAYSKGHVAYHLTTFLRDGDRRAIRELTINLPRGQAGRVRRWLRGRRDYPLNLILLEVAGNLMGPFGLWRSRRRVGREGRSGSDQVRGERRTSLRSQRGAGDRARALVPAMSNHP